MMRSDYNKTAKFLREVALLYGLLVLTGISAFIFPAYQRDKPVSAVLQIEFDPYYWLIFNRSCNISREVMGFHVECAVENQLIGCIAASFFIVCAAIYYGIRHNSWRKKPETGYLCDHLVHDTTPKIKAGFQLVILTFGLALVVSIIHPAVLGFDLATEHLEEKPKEILISVIEGKLFNAGLACAFHLCNVMFSYVLYKKFYKWDFKLDDMSYMAPLTHNIAPFLPPLFSEPIAMSRREADWPPEYSSQETVL